MTGHPGTRGRYTNGCRCEDCREANRVYIEHWRRRRGVQPQRFGTWARHGELNRYRHGCRCDPCKAANATKHREWAQSRRKVSA